MKEEGRTAPDAAVSDEIQKVAVVGLGYVGLPLALLFVSKGFEVYGIDIDRRKIEMLEGGKSYLPDVSDAEVKSRMASGLFHPTADMALAGEAKAVIICVPTPLTPYHTPDLSFLQDAARAVGETLVQGQTVILESSTYPGTTREVLKPILEKTSGLRAGKDFYLGYSPERIDPGNKVFTVERIPKLISGLTEPCCDRVERLYGRVFERVVRVSSPEIAEMAKIVENSQRLVNITFMNELALICDAMNINVWEVIDAAATKPFGFTAYYPGPGIGGHCIPVDPLYLQWKSRAFDAESKFIELSEKMNRAMPEIVANRLFELLAEHSRQDEASSAENSHVENPNIVAPSNAHAPDSGRSDSDRSNADGLNEEARNAEVPHEEAPNAEALNNGESRRKPYILLYGVAYKKDVNDVRESPALDLIPILIRKGARVDYHDPYIDEIKVNDVVYRSVELTDEKLAEADCVLILTNHSQIPVERIVKHASLVFDTRNAASAFKHEKHVHIFGGGRHGDRAYASGNTSKKQS